MLLVCSPLKAKHRAPCVSPAQAEPRLPWDAVGSGAGAPSVPHTAGGAAHTAPSARQSRAHPCAWACVHSLRVLWAASGQGLLRERAIWEGLCKRVKNSGACSGPWYVLEPLWFHKPCLLARQEGSGADAAFLPVFPGHPSGEGHCAKPALERHWQRFGAALLRSPQPSGLVLGWRRGAGGGHGLPGSWALSCLPAAPCY